MSNTLKSRISVIILITLLLSLMSTMCFATEANVTETTKQEVTAEPVKARLNTKIYFEGKTYTFHDGRRVRRTYEDGKLGCGIVSIIIPNKEYGVYVSGEGWIAESQIKSAEKYISLEFNKENLKNGELGSTLKINGEFVNVESNNTGIIRYENETLVAGLNGTTTVKITTKEGKEIEALATVYDGNVELNIPEKSVSMDGQITADIADKKVNISADGDAEVALKIENGSIGVEAEGNGNVKATVEDKEVLDVNVNASGSVTASKDGITAEAKASQTIKLLQKLTVKLNENANAHINKEEVEVGVGADASVNDKQVASGDASVKYEYGEEDPTGSAHLTVLDKNVVNAENKTIPVISALKALLARIK